ncbi:hypothetical protein DL98DRAFT_550369 [Cadophora sp. DSE1049]|nr:hypothetical protein DL98DRAFT_550369 [Cadophora sp. DSE1049]
MALSINAVSSLMGGLNIADKTSGVNVQAPRPSSLSLQESIKSLDQSAKITSSQAQQAPVLVASTTHGNSLDITGICSLYRTASDVTEVARILDDTANTLRDTAERSMVASLVALGGKGGANVRDGSLLRRMLSHFDNQIRSIVRAVLSNSSYGNCILWKIAEECYNQTTSSSRALHSDRYFVERDEACFEWPYDPDYEAEEYYEHEDRLEIDEDYARAMEEQRERRRKEREREEQGWINFWVLILHRCPDGPTLFYPPASPEVTIHLLASADIPQYLFRTFDSKSSGINNDKIVASIASIRITQSPQESRKDLLSLPKLEALDMLHTHLNKPCWGGEDADNLMSWTSSLLFAIQYAIWRRRTFGCHPADIKICVVGGKINDFFRFRLEDTRYHNGEYLSQGSDSGLYDLYPEFANIEGTKKWANRVRELREGWSIEQRTTPREIQLASEVARKCFNTFETSHMMLILLTFKARKVKGDVNNDNRYCPEWARRPDELRRYGSAVRLLKSRRQSMKGWGNAFRPVLNDALGIHLVEEMFD